MKAIAVTDEVAGTAGMTLVERPEPEAAINDVVVQLNGTEGINPIPYPPPAAAVLSA